jgi:hypothetical protein
LDIQNTTPETRHHSEHHIRDQASFRTPHKRPDTIQNTTLETGHHSKHHIRDQTSFRTKGTVVVLGLTKLQTNTKNYIKADNFLSSSKARWRGRHEGGDGGCGVRGGGKQLILSDILWTDRKDSS